LNKSVVIALAVATLAGLGGYGLSNYAVAHGASLVQVTPAMDPPPSPHDRGHRRWMIRNWGLFYPQTDKKLSAADVQTIAEAMLLRHGNHTWKVTDVAQNQDDTVSFAFATQSGDVVARFAMDIHTGRLHRRG
jgi:hypothetical protein